MMAPYEEGLVLLAPLVVDAPGSVEAVREYILTHLAAARDKELQLKMSCGIQPASEGGEGKDGKEDGPGPFTMPPSKDKANRKALHQLVKSHFPLKCSEADHLHHLHSKLDMVHILWDVVTLTGRNQTP